MLPHRRGRNRSVGRGGRQLAYYAARILKGAKPSDLPVESPTRFELVVNLKSADQIGIKLPTALITQADEIIE